MNHWIILPILLPAVVAPLLAMSVRHDIVLARVFSLGSTIFLLLLGMIAMGAVADGDILTYTLGDWAAPYGIVLVLDRLSALMLVLTAFMGLFVVLYAMDGCDKKGQHFHPLIQFQLMGLNGAFLTGDFFNLFVFFEVLLIASYGLLVHGGGAARVRAAIQYMVINLLGSSIFLIGLSLLYGVMGTLNMADVARKLPEVSPSDQGLLMAGATLLIIVFGIKSAIFPLQFWLPGTYTNAVGPIAALFAVLTKVGVYALIRVNTLTHQSETTTTFGALDWLMPAAAITLVIGMVGVVAARSLGQQASFVALGSLGTLLISVAAFTPTSHAAALYYLLHSTLGMGVLFLVVDLVIQRRPGEGDALTTTAPFDEMGLVGSMFFLAAIAMLGMPPLSGFIGKLLILEGIRGSPGWGWLWGLILGTSVVALIGMSRSGSTLFWKSRSVAGHLSSPRDDSRALPLVATGALVASLVLLTGFSGLVTSYLDRVAEQLFQPQIYIDAVLLSPQEPV